jgi:hypothetical protein
MHKDYERNIYECVEVHKKQIMHSFYVLVVTKREQLMQNVLRNYFFARTSCPSPDWDQTVYKYHYDDDAIEFLWVIPSRDTCELLKANAIHVAPEERDLLNFVLDFEDGTLLKYSKRMNGEVANSNILAEG